MISGTKEWAVHSANISKGCSHRCLYCYASSMAVRFGRATPATWGDERLDPAKVDKRYSKRVGRIMYPTTHDITPDLLGPSITVLRKMLQAGNEVLVVSKPHEPCIRVLCEELRPWREQIMFRFTIGSTDDEVLRFWEPGAPGFRERLWCLRHAYKQGFATSVSCEPMLDRNVVAVVDYCAPAVTDSIWIGKANKLVQRMTQNGCTAEQIERGRELVSWQSDKAIRELYDRLKDHPLVRWKESIKSVVGLELPTEAGLDR